MFQNPNSLYHEKKKTKNILDYKTIIIDNLIVNYNNKTVTEESFQKILSISNALDDEY